MQYHAENAANDQELSSLREAIIVTDSRISDLLKRVDTGESGAMWRKLRDALKEHDKAERLKDAELKVYWWGEIHDLITYGSQDYDAWDEVHSVIDRQTKLLVNERKRIMDLHQVIESNEVLGLFSALLSVVNDNVPDRMAMSRISREAQRLIRGGAPVR